jgi:hypothetical protein
LKKLSGEDKEKYQKYVDTLLEWAEENGHMGKRVPFLTAAVEGVE